MEKLLRAGFAALGLPLDETALTRFETYYELLEERSKVMNLTAIHGETDVAQLHFLDSAALLTVEPLAGKSVIDVGTGAGFPGLPLKIAAADISLTLLDSLDKRVRLSRRCLHRDRAHGCDVPARARGRSAGSCAAGSTRRSRARSRGCTCCASCACRLCARAGCSSP